MRSLNDPRASSDSSQPRGAVRLNDLLIDGWKSWEVENNNWYSADTFRVKFIIQELPPERDEAWFSEQSIMFVELYGGWPADPDNFSCSELTSQIYGKVDDIDYDPVAGTIELIGRDLTSEFIDNKTTEKWPNLTASEIAIKLAKRRNLNPVVTKTTDKVGKYYEIDHVNLTDQRSEWDLLNYLAHLEEFVVYVRGTHLYFGPKTDPNSTPYVVEWQKPDADNPIPESNTVDLKFRRSLTVARGIQVVVRSWNAKQKKGFTVSYPNKAKSTQAGKAKPFGGAQIYSYTIAGLTKEQALQRAQSIYAELVAHEMKLTATLPADDLVNVTTMLQVIGTGTKWDQTYFPDSITRRMDFDGGYPMTIDAKNHSPDSQVQL